MPTPQALRQQVALTADELQFIQSQRQQIAAIVAGQDPRLLVVVGPCSIHDVEGAYEFAARLKALSDELSDSLLVVMRTYFEKPRTNEGWTGLLMDPALNGAQDVVSGLVATRQFLKKLAQLRLCAGMEMLSPLTPPYLADMVSWAAIGARTAQSSVHRHIASGLPMPVGVKNNTAGCIQSAVLGMKAVQKPQCYLSINDQGQAAAIHTSGNKHAHIILRGGQSGPNYAIDSIHKAAELMSIHGLAPRIMIDCSHGNSSKNHLLQPIVFNDVLTILQSSAAPVLGLMLESYLKAGNQPYPAPHLEYGVSITDKCLDFSTTEGLLRRAYAVMKARSFSHLSHV